MELLRGEFVPSLFSVVPFDDGGCGKLNGPEMLNVREGDDAATEPDTTVAFPEVNGRGLEGGRRGARREDWRAMQSKAPSMFSLALSVSLSLSLSLTSATVLSSSSL